MNKKLNLMERFLLLNLLPTEGNFATLKMVRKLREDLSCTPEEYTNYEVVEDGGKVKWNFDKGMEEKDFEFDDFGKDLIKSRLNKLNEENKLDEKQFTLFEKFVEVS